MSSYINTILCNVLAEQERLLAGYELQSTPYDTTSLTTTYPETYHSDYNPETSEKTDFLENTVLRNVLAEQDQLLAEYELQSTPYDTTSLTTTHPKTYHSDYNPETSEKTDFLENTVLRNVLAEQDQLLAEYELQSTTYDTTSLTTTYPEASIPDTSDNITGESMFDIPNNPFTEASIPDTSDNIAGESMFDIPNNPFTEASISDTSDNIAGESVFDIPNNPFTEASIPDTSDNIAGESMFDIPNNPFTEATMPDTSNTPFTEATMTATLNNHQNQFIQIEKQVADMPSQQGLQNILNQTGQIPPEETTLLPLQNQK